MAATKLLRAAIVGATLFAASVVPAAAAWPDKPVKFIVTFPAGGMTDILARNIGQELSKRIGQPVIIDNRGGMAGSIGAQAGAKVPADGYTFTFANVGAMTLNTVLYKDLGYDPLKDFVPVAGVAAVPNVVAVPSNSPYRTLAELIEDARRNPGKLNYASTGTGASPWLGTEYLKSLAKLDIVEVPYKGAGPALIDTMAGRTAFVFDAVSTSRPQLEAGTIRALGVSSAKRVAALPDVPTIAEQGYPGFDVVAWFGLWAPTGTPEDVVRRVNAEVRAILESPDIRAKFNGMGAETMSGTVEEFTKYHREEYQRWTEFVRGIVAKPQ